MQPPAPASRPDWVPKLRGIEASVLWIFFTAIGLLQMNRVHLGVITDYGADVVCPALLFVITRQGRSVLRHLGMRPDRPAVIAAGVFWFSAAWEIAQRFHWIPGVFDPLDLLAYAIGVLVPYLVDRWLSSRDRIQSA